MNSQVTSFIIHKGDSWYLKNAVNSLIRSGWENIIILGDNNNKYIENIDPKSIKHINFSNLSSENIKLLDNNYFHIGVTPPDYEKFCFLRWVYLDAAVQTLNVKKILLIDSDVLFFASPSSVESQLINEVTPSYFVTLKHNPSCFIANDAQIVFSNMSKFINGIYIRNEDEVRRYVKERQVNREHSSKNEFFYKQFDHAEHFSDMDMLQEFWEACSGENTISTHAIDCEIRTNLLPGSNGRDSSIFLYNSNFSSLKSSSFYWDGKKLIMDDKFEIKSLHFQGASKRYISLVDAVCSAPIPSRFSIGDNDDFIVSFNVTLNP